MIKKKKLETNQNLSTAARSRLDKNMDFHVHNRKDKIKRNSNLKSIIAS